MSQISTGRWTLDFGLWTLSDHRAGAPPACVVDEIQEDVRRWCAFVVRPIYEHRAPDDQVARHEAPVTTVGAVVAIVAHDEVTVGWDSDDVVVLEGWIIVAVVIQALRRRAPRPCAPIDRVRPFALRRRIVFEPQRRGVFALFGARVVLIVLGRHDVLGERLTIDDDARTFDLDLIAGQTDDALDVVSNKRRVVRVVLLRDGHAGDLIAGIFEDNDVAALYVALRQERQVRPRRKD